MKDFKKTIKNLKERTFKEAKSKSLQIFNSKNEKIGSLVPVGDWILEDKEKIGLICAWRQKAMLMSLTHFQSTYEKTYAFLQNFSVALENRLLFLIYDRDDSFLGHIGVANVNALSFELDNLVRGVSGGGPQLIYFAEITLLDWCFRNLGINYSNGKVLSYNWTALSLHEEVGYSVVEQIPLLRNEKDGNVAHEFVSLDDTNVDYSCISISIKKDEFYKKAHWLVI